MEIINTHKGTFLVGNQQLLHLATLTDAERPGTYILCRASDSTESNRKTILYHNASSVSQPVRIMDESIIKNARKALLDWHQNNCKNCVENSPQHWDYCQEAQEMLSHS